MFTKCPQRQISLKLFAFIVLATVAVLFAAVPEASGQSYRGSLQGTVQDGSGAAVPSAKVTLRGAEFSFEREVASDSNGAFRLDDVPPGTYRLVVRIAGFAEAASDVHIAVSSVREVVVTLKPQTLQQSVTVAAQSSSITTQQLDVSSDIHQGIITSRDLQDIPLAARSFANIAYLAPGTEPVEPSDPTKARITAVSTGGSSGLNNDLSVDGADNSDDYIGGFLQNFSPDAIQEFAFRTAQEDADTGRTTAGSVVITTRRGTDDWHGDFAFYERAAGLDARYPIENPAPNPKQPFSRQNYIGAVGGPVAPGKLWFFSSFEYVHERASIAYSPESTLQFNALASLAAQGLIPSVSSINVPTIVPIPFHDTLGTFRLDWQQSANAQWFLRAAVDTYLTENDLIQQGTLPTTGATSHSNYLNLAIGQQYEFSPTWVGSFLLGASTLHHTEAASQHLGFSLQFPFSSTFETISGLDTFGDNSFATPITAFPVLRNQEKYQLRYDVSHSSGKHAPRFGVNFIHEPVLSGALSGTAENITTFAQDPSFYAANPQQFAADLNCSGAGGLAITPGTVCSSIPASDGGFSQDVQRLGFYAEDSWRITPRLTVNYGLRYDTTFGLFEASGRNQLQNPSYLTLQALGIPLLHGAPHDYRKAFAPRLGLAYAPGNSDKTVFRAGIGLYYNDLAQNGWVSAFQAVNAAPGPCIDPLNPPDATNSGCVPAGSPGALIDPNYHTPYALHVTGGVQHSFNTHWSLSADYTHEQGVHGYRRYQYTPGFTIDANAPDLAVFRSDNRSSYNALMLHLQGNVSRHFNLIANYTLSSAKTWGCVLGELFDYVNGVCNPNNAFAPGDYGPSGEDVTHRGVIAGVFTVPAGFQLSMLFQAESGRPVTLTTPEDVNGFGDTLDDRAVVNGVQTSLDEFRGTPYVQMDLRVARPINRERWQLTPFIEFFNLFNRNNPGANYVTNIAALPVPVNSLTNATAFCPTPACNVPITSPKQLLVPAGALGDFFGPGTTVGIPFAAQIGVRLTF